MGVMVILVMWHRSDHLYKLSFPLPKKAPYEIWLWLVKGFQRRRCLKLLTTTMPTPKHGYTVSSPCEPDSSLVWLFWTLIMILSYILQNFNHSYLLLTQARIVREPDYSPAAVPCMQLKARVSQDIEWQCNSDINEGP